MTRACYVPLAEYEGGWFPPDRQTVVAIADDRVPIKTGLLDANGTPLYRMPETVPVGFQGKRL